ncbi:sodium:proton antiporter NhaD [Flavobacterium urocaniciphilum]|uniref:Sodium/proton antiporter, NhaD family n=1 Tax=Flavobacterium urocaniciphilum TaxID=1299341 RepID=A0A1H8Z5M3_9FLAO|nr:sodium:proton antiporter NhaD [Flavobacterium urocaniciphilum]SEP59759.1 sodium/proton antiporter, NhaD family [Flavobacterium urocaniciphilum]
MTILVLAIFIIGYLLIAFEHPLKLNKAASALLTGVLCWTIYIFSQTQKEVVVEELLHHLGEIASILFFLLGAMTIVELIDSHDGFKIITNKIKTRSKSRLLWIIAIITFFLSALLDNLTTAIVMTSLITKLLKEKEDRLWFVGLIIIAANAGGAFSPLGDVTTTMLWIGNQITALNIIKELFIPSIFVCLIPLLILSYKFRKQTFIFENVKDDNFNEKEANLVLIVGIAMLLFVPIFKMITHLPPFMGVMLALSILWVFVSIIHKDKPEDVKNKYMVTHALQKVDSPSILFFLGILLAVSSLQSFGILGTMAESLTSTLKDEYLIGTVLGLLSAVVDNVPLVAAVQGMFSLEQYPTDHHFWEFLALTTGTGGSAIIIGSAAGVAAMGIENVDFMWYLKKISWLALIGFFAGILVFLGESYLFNF